jgi:integrase
MSPAALPPLRATRLLDQVRERVRYLHYSLSTEHCYVQWVRRFVRFHGLRHPRDMAGPEVEAFAAPREPAAGLGLHAQASALGLPRSPLRLPTVLSRDEVARLLACTSGVPGLALRLLYGTGMRKMECLRLRVKDVDLDRRLIIVREGKGQKDRRTVLPAAPAPALHDRLQLAHALWRTDRGTDRPGVEIPPGLARKYPRADRSWVWFWLSPDLHPRAQPRRARRAESTG